MSNIPQDEPEERVTICFKANREFRVALDMVLAKKQITVQEFCLEAVGRAVAAAEEPVSKSSPQQSDLRRRRSA